MGELHFGDRVGGKYTLIGCTGRGGMAEVWIARNDATSGDVAIKMLRSDRRAVDQAEERFHQEARVSANLTHPNVARVFDLVEADDGALLLVMERLRGETLRDKLVAGPIEPAMVISFCLPILDALEAAHRAGIVHRDVNPANIFLAEDADARITPKLIDFGVAKSAEAVVVTKAGVALGTPHYMSPEQIHCGIIDGRSDLFSFSVSLYESMTGVNPFKKRRATESLAAVLSVAVHRDDRIPEALWQVISRGLARNPDDRWSCASEMATALRTALGQMSLPSITSGETAIEIPVTHAPRFSWRAPAAALGLLLAALAGAGIFAGAHRPALAAGEATVVDRSTESTAKAPVALAARAQTQMVKPREMPLPKPPVKSIKPKKR